MFICVNFVKLIVFLTFNLCKVWIKCVSEKALSESLEGTFCLATHTARKVDSQHLVSNFHQQHQILEKSKILLVCDLISQREDKTGRTEVNLWREREGGCQEKWQICFWCMDTTILLTFLGRHWYFSFHNQAAMLKKKHGHKRVYHL